MTVAKLKQASVVMVHSTQQLTRPTLQVNSSMENTISDEIKNLKRELIDGITRYMKYGGAEDESDPDYDPNFNAGYSQAHVDRCAEILDAFLSDIEKVSDATRDQDIIDAVKTVVLGLNDVNNACGGSLIETDQREQLCDLIIAAADEAGLVSTEDDITEEWREW